MARFEPADTLVGPIIHELAAIIADQIGGVGTIYELPPDGPPEDNSIQFPFQMDVSDETVGKLRIDLSFDIHHNFRRTRFSEDYARAQTYVIPWVLALATWENQTLNGLAFSLKPGKVRVIQMVTSQTPYVSVVSRLVVSTEINIPVA